MVLSKHYTGGEYITARDCRSHSHSDDDDID
jgi:hypothetical protein